MTKWTAQLVIAVYLLAPDDRLKANMQRTAF
jgi:hypothetical protein